MEQSAWIGLAVGGSIGGAYAWFQLRSLRRTPADAADDQTTGLAPQVPGAVARLTVLVVLLVLLVAVPGEKIHKGWLTGSLAVFYGVPLVWRLRQIFTAKQ